MKTKSGFTLVEIMIVVAIIGLLAGMSTLAITKSVKNSKIKTAEAELDMLAAAVLQLAWDTGRWPNGALRTSDGSATANNEMWDLSASGLIYGTGFGDDWKGPYYESDMLTDPWGMPYFFDSDYKIDGANRTAVGSLGPNKTGRNRYNEDNIATRVDD